ncbi:MAG: hypothetical protein IH986_08360 [Planctomycetes bacterium]|nr:hypothetical protein [Planctomycetota bacterium]
MKRETTATLGIILLTGTLLIGGCPGSNFLFAGLTDVRVEIFNDTDFLIVPDIRFGDDDGDVTAFFTGLFGGDKLATGSLNSGEFIEFTFACDELGLVFAKESEQRLFNEVIGESDQTDGIQRGEEFECGDRIQFRFIGSFEDFDVLVTVNGRVVD